MDTNIKAEDILSTASDGGTHEPTAGRNYAECVIRLAGTRRSIRIFAENMEEIDVLRNQLWEALDDFRHKNQS